MNFIPIILSLFLALCLQSHASTEQKRLIFSPWSSEEAQKLYSSPVIRHVENVLNHLGYLVHYVDIDSQPLPDPQSKSFKNTYEAIVTYFDGEYLSRANLLADWLQKAGASNNKWIALGKLGIIEKLPTTRTQKLLSAFGVKYHERDRVPLIIKAKDQHAVAMNFERPLTLNQYPPIESPSGAWLRLQAPGEEHHSTPIFHQQNLSMAYGNYGLYSDPRKQWQVNPFLFFRKALKIEDHRPVPDVNVLNGTRVYYSHIDGDAFNSLSRINPKLYCGEMIDTEIVQKYPLLPIGISIIVAEVHKSHRGNQRLLDAARNILSRPNVEPASHTFFHPLYWNQRVLAYSNQKTFSLAKETNESIDVLQSLVSEKKKLETLYWSGDCMPPKKALELLASRGFLNINGGDGQFDRLHPSIAYLSPLGRFVGEYYQVFSSNANDNIYTNGWEGPYFGMRKVIETFENTGSPRILKPINPYYHFFSAERQAGLNALHKIADYVQTQSIAPIYPSDYIKSVLGFKNAQITQTGTLSYFLKNTNGLNTARIDSYKWAPALDSSKGVIGYNQTHEATYIHLDPNTENIKLTLQNANQPNKSVYLKQLMGKLLNYKHDNKSITLTLAPFSRSPLVLHSHNNRSSIVKINNVSSKHESANNTLSIPFVPSSNPTTIEVLL